MAGGTRALFYQQMNYQVDDGAQPLAVPGFSSAAYVGLTGPAWGTLTLGRQKDFTLDLAVMRLDTALDIGGNYAQRAGPSGKLGLPLSPNGANWDRFNGIAASNAIKYVTPDWNGLSARVMHAFGEQPGAASRETGESAFLCYASGPFAAGAGYTRIRFPTVNAGQDGAAIAAAGARYQIGNWRLNGLYSSVRNTFTGAAVHAVERGAAGFYAPWVPGFSIEHMQGNGGVDHAWANQLNLQGSYFLSKRTYVYLMAVLQRTNAGARATINTLVPSSDKQQGVYRLGITTLF